jgi:hypothetical protein
MVEASTARSPPAPGRGVAKFDDTYSADPANLGRVNQPTLLNALQEILANCQHLLAPDGTWIWSPASLASASGTNEDRNPNRPVRTTAHSGRSVSDPDRYR